MNERARQEARTDRRFTIGMLAPCPFPTHQGTQVLIRHLAAALSRAGHRVHLVTYGYGEYDEALPFRVHRARRFDAGLRSGPNWTKPAADAAMLVAAHRVVKSEKVDLWHVHNIEGLALGALLKLHARLPLVYHAHNAMGPELPVYFRRHITRVLASKLGDVLDQTLPRAADAVVVFDPDQKTFLEVSGVSPQRVHVIPPGLDGSEVAPADPAEMAKLRERYGGGPWLIYAGNPDPYQNLPLMWRAFALVREKRPDVRLLMVSHHPAAAFAGELNSSGAPGGVVFHQYRDIAELRALLALAEVGLSPRTLWVGAPIKVLNYLAAGVPVVACRSGARHVVTPECGVLVDGTAEAFASGIFRLLLEPLDRDGCRTGFERFSIEAQVPRYEETYAALLRDAG
ncbi:MAG: glycosyltransferase family 4 protein [Deltaproteobacteria bacterium]|nr:glycosyltransferase family 4 protein [Deltaproteobacteria bacterium]